jgi:hypothetical protein
MTARLALIDALAADGLIDRTRTEAGLRVRLRNTPQIERRTRELIAAESRCCAFLEFTLDRNGGELVLDISGPQDAQIPVDRVDINAPRDSDAWYVALMGHQFPGSFLPFGHEQIVRSASPHFSLVSSMSGRLDYIETIHQWRKRFAQRSARKLLLKLRLLPRWLSSADFRLAFTSGVSANSVCFERELLDHYRLVFEKTR